MRKLKRSIRVLQRACADYWRYPKGSFAGTGSLASELNTAITLSQIIHKNEGYENKVFNLKMAADKINAITLLPGQIFSFWKTIGNPDRGFKTSRSIRNGKLIEETGGGLCQISGAMFHLALMVNLKVIERHNHSIDIYTKETRFTPLGTDATVVYGYKDLRIKNCFDFPISFEFLIDQEKLTVNLKSTMPISARKLLYQSDQTRDTITARIKDTEQNLISISHYKNR